MLNCSRCQQRSRSELVRSKQAHQIAMMMCQDHHVPLIPMDSFVHSTCFIFNANACSMQQMITKNNRISFKNLFVCVFVSKLAQCFCKCNIPHRVAVEEPMTAPVLKASSSTGEHFHSSDTIIVIRTHIEIAISKLCSPASQSCFRHGIQLAGWAAKGHGASALTFSHCFWWHFLTELRVPWVVLAKVSQILGPSAGVDVEYWKIELNQSKRGHRLFEPLWFWVKLYFFLQSKVVSWLGLGCRPQIEISASSCAFYWRCRRTTVPIMSFNFLLEYVLRFVLVLALWNGLFCFTV